MGGRDKRLRAREFRSIEDSFRDLLVYAPGDKEDKQEFIRERTKQLVSKSSYERMFERLVEVAGRGGAGELIFDYVLEAVDDRIRELLWRSRRGQRVSLRESDRRITEVLFFQNGRPRRVAEHLIEYWETMPEPGTPDQATGEANMSSYQHEYEVALSFAGENRSYVKEVARALDRKGVQVFYDEFEETTLWGKDLTVYLDKIYREKAKYCVLFISKEHTKKDWPQFEAQSALARAVEERKEYILPVQMDDTRLEGLTPSVKYVEAENHSPEELAELIERKIQAS